MRRPALAATAVGVALCGVLGCVESNAPPEGPSIPQVSFTELVTVVDSVQLEEDDTTLIVAPFVSFGRGGTYLLADAKEAQVRRYRPDGSLDLVMGRKGRGPGELVAPVAVMPRGDELWVFDMANGVVRYDDSTGEYRGRSPLPISLIYDVEAGPSGRLLLAGQVSGGEVLHLWSPGADGENTEVVSFLDTEEHFAPPMVRRSYGWAAVSEPRDGVFAAVVGLADSLYLVDSTGVIVEAHQVPIGQFYRALVDFKPERISNPMAREEWASGLKRMNDVVRIGGDRFLIQYSTREGRNNVWNLVLMDSGLAVAEARNTPRLVASRDGLLVFQASVDIEPSRLHVGRIGILDGDPPSGN